MTDPCGTPDREKSTGLVNLPASLLRMCPIFQISNVTGENMDLLKMFLNLLSSRTSYRDDQPAEFQIDDTYSVPVLLGESCCTTINTICLRPRLCFCPRA